jgi:hypothetical protein
MCPTLMVTVRCSFIHLFVAVTTVVVVVVAIAINCIAKANVYNFHVFVFPIISDLLCLCVAV